MRTPSRAARPSVASAIIEPMAAIENAPLATPSRKTLARSGQAGPPAGQHQAAMASAEARQPPTVQAAQRAEAAPASAGPASAPAACRPARRRAARPTAASIRPA
jgi:hypothetical protein